MIPLGYKAAMNQEVALKVWAEPESVYSTWKLRHDATRPPLPIIDAVEVDPIPGMDIRRVSHLVQTKPGKTLDTVVLGAGPQTHLRHRSLRDRQLHHRPGGRPDRPAHHGDAQVLGPHVPEARALPGHRLRGGDAVRRRGADLGDRDEPPGGEWKTTLTVGSPLELKTRFYQPLNFRGPIFVSPYACSQDRSGYTTRRATRWARTRLRAEPRAGPRP